MSPPIDALREALASVVRGQHAVIDDLVTAIIARGHVLLEGVPGVAKTLAARSLAEALSLEHRRIQFTPDLMPTDVTGTSVFRPNEGTFVVVRGPVFTELLLADELNRTPPKTQAALLEAMEERQVTLDGQTHPLSRAFTVVATQNPLELEGTYPLPEAQLDRFLFKLKVRYPSAEELHTILDRTTSTTTPQVQKVLGSAADVTALREVVRGVPLVREVQDFAVRLTLATHPEHAREGSLAKKFVRYGASPRGSQALILGAKIYALLDGRFHVAKADIAKAAPGALRHRVILNFEGEAEGKTSDEVIAEALGV